MLSTRSSLVFSASLLCVVSLPACAANERQTPGPAPPSSHEARPSLPSLSSLCGDAGKGSHALFFRASDGARLYGAVFGRGPVGVVVANDVPHPLCEEVQAVRPLADRGLRVLVFDYRDREESGRASAPGRLDLDVSAGVAELRRSGARKVVLLGAYAGGALSIVAAARLGGSVAGVVGISTAPRKGEFVNGPYSGPGALDVAPRLRVPVLLVAASGDRFVPLKRQRELLRLLGSPGKQLVVLPYGLGGWDILNLSSLADRTIDMIVRFVHRVSR
jgi:pimeloyl-ACP methyl ester carboxylesterase